MLETIFSLLLAWGFATIFGWIFLSFICGLALSKKKMGFWGTFFLCLILSPLLGVIISAVSGDKEKPKPKKSQKELLLNQIEELKKEDELGLISEKNKLKLEKLTHTYKNYDETLRETKLNRRKEQEEQNKKMGLVLLGIFISLVVALTISYFVV